MTTLLRQTFQSDAAIKKKKKLYWTTFHIMSPGQLSAALQSLSAPQSLSASFFFTLLFWFIINTMQLFQWKISKKPKVLYLLGTSQQTNWT